MNKIISFIKEHFMFIFCMILSFGFLTICSKNSFLYPFNDWVDENAFFTMGKSMMNSVVPYRDLFEQKGPLLYFIFGIGYLISPQTFHGVFVLEIIFFTFYLYFSHKFYSLFVNKNFSYLILPFQALITVTWKAFVHGGSCEELCLPLFVYTLYSFFRHFTEDECSPKILAINGFVAGCIFMIKYTLIGFWFSFMMFIFFDLVFKKKIKKAFTSCLWFLFGMALPILIFCVYFAVNGALKDFIECYITINFTAYTGNANGIVQRISTLVEGYFTLLREKNTVIWLLIVFAPVFIIPLKTRIYPKFCLVGSFCITTFLMFYGLKFYNYYILPSVIFTIPSFAGICSIVEKIMGIANTEKIKIKKSVIKYGFCGVCTICTGVCLFFSYRNANYREMINMPKENLTQYKFAKIINEEKNPTLLNMGNLDGGFYTVTGIIPNTRFFELQNIPYDKFPDNIDQMREAVKEKKVQFVVYVTSMKNTTETIKESYPEIFENYDLIESDTVKDDKKTKNAFLFKVKE